MSSNSYLRLNHLRFHYRYWGGEGRPLVLLHGLASNARIWDAKRVAPRLAEHFRVFALDQRSHGLTDRADDGYDFPSIARAIYEQKTSELYARLRLPALLCLAVPPPPRDENAEQFLARKREGIARAEQAAPLVWTVWFEDTVHDIPLHRPAELAQAILDFGFPL